MKELRNSFRARSSELLSQLQTEEELSSIFHFLDVSDGRGDGIMSTAWLILVCNVPKDCLVELEVEVDVVLSSYICLLLWRCMRMTTSFSETPTRL